MRLYIKRAQGGPDYYGPGTGYAGPHVLYRYEEGSVWYRTEARARRALKERVRARRAL